VEAGGRPGAVVEGGELDRTAAWGWPSGGPGGRSRWGRVADVGHPTLVVPGGRRWRLCVDFGMDEIVNSKQGKREKERKRAHNGNPHRFVGLSNMTDELKLNSSPVSPLTWPTN
jgi:hypothetical protein